MIKEYTIENFKAFKGTATIPIKPITLIFGPNSSGKSSIFQSLLMLKQTMEDGAGLESILLTKGSLVDLGSYREFVYNHDTDLSFSFKVAVTAPKKIDDLFIMDDFVSHYNPLTEKLVRSLHCDTMELEVVFNLYEKTEIVVSKINLFLGNKSTPIISYGSIWSDRTFSQRCESLLKYGDLKEQYGADYDIHLKYELMDSMKIIKTNGKDDYWINYYLEFYSRDIAMEENLNNHKDYFSEFIEGDLEEEVIGLVHFLPDVFSMGNPLRVIANCLDKTEANYGKSISLFALSISESFKRFLRNVQFIGPLRPAPERFYVFSGNRTGFVGSSGKYVLDILVPNNKLLLAVNRQFKRLGLDYELNVSEIFGKDNGVDGLYTLRLCNKSTRVITGLADVGFGISQVLPVIVQSMLSKQKTILIEQPELHLHPAQQAELGDMFIESALGESKNTFLIETHSEHLILRIMRRIRETHNGTIPDGLPGITPNDVAVLYVEPDGENGSIIREMPLNELGELVKAWPGGFFEEGLKEVLS